MHSAPRSAATNQSGSNGQSVSNDSAALTGRRSAWRAKSSVCGLTLGEPTLDRPKSGAPAYCVIAALAIATLSGCAAKKEVDMPATQQQVLATERAFAKTMVDHDFVDFQSYLSGEAVFYTDHGPLMGKRAVADAWQVYYNSPAAPFTWEPSDAVVLPSGRLAMTTGPVRDAKGKQIATFNSIWRLDEDGKWRIIFDKGCEACGCGTSR